MLDKEEQIRKNCMAFSNNLDTKSPKQVRTSETIKPVEKWSAQKQTPAFTVTYKKKVNYSLQP